MEARRPSSRVQLGNQRLPSMLVPGELFEVYQPVLDAEAMIVWLNLYWAATCGHCEEDVEQWLIQRLSIDRIQVAEALQHLARFELLEMGEGGTLILHEPLTSFSFAQQFPQATQGMKRKRTAVVKPLVARAKRREARDAIPSVAGEPRSDLFANQPATHEGASLTKDRPASPPSDGVASNRSGQTMVLAAPEAERGSGNQSKPEASDALVTEAISRSDEASEDATRVDSGGAPGGTGVEAREMALDIDAVIHMYQKNIGMLGPVQKEKLRFWVEEKKMPGEVVAYAIMISKQRVRYPRIEYIEGILRNWFNDGFRKLEDIHKSEQAERTASGSKGSSQRETPAAEGRPNASAYRQVDQAAINRWRELYPDEYDESN